MSVVAAWGGGTNSTAMLIECHLRGESVDAVLFADTGGEKPNTYAFVEVFSAWLVAHGMPPITTVQYRSPHRSGTLEDDCLEKRMLPSLAYGFKSCSLKYKKQPQDAWVRKNFPGATRLIGFDASEARRAKGFPDERYPLIEWGIDRDACVEIIEDAGLPSPGKSSCFFCPASTLHEVRELKARHPDLYERALAMECGAELTTVRGLGRRWAWRSLESEVNLFGDMYADAPCDCYDGGQGEP